MDNHENKIAIICDFDGTVSVRDVNNSIFHDFGNNETEAIENDYMNSRIGIRESLEAQYRIIGISEETFNNYVLENMEIDPAFFDLVDLAKNKKMQLSIISGGFINYIKILFNKHKRELNIPVYANELVVEKGILVPKYGCVPDCDKHYGPCGICKRQRILDYKKDYKVIYVGDGFTDRCAAENSDAVFAKDNLAIYCKQNGIKHIGYNSFVDVNGYIVEHILKNDL